MSSLNLKLIALLPSSIIDYILEIAGYHKFRNGKYIAQLDKSKFKKLMSIPPLIFNKVQFIIKSLLFNSSYCDKIITIKIINYYIYSYDCSWYVYDYCNCQHHIETEENFVFYKK